MTPPPPRSTLFPYTTLFRSVERIDLADAAVHEQADDRLRCRGEVRQLRRQRAGRSEEHTSELQSHSDLVCRLLLEKKKSTSDSCPFTPRSIVSPDSAVK